MTFKFRQRENSQQLLSRLQKVINQMHLDTKNRQLLNMLKWLNQVQFIIFQNHGQSNQNAERINLNELSCQYCNAVMKNVLLLLIHLSFAHDIDSFRFEICQGDQVLKVVKQAKKAKMDHSQKQLNMVFCHNNYFQRLSSLLKHTLSKIRRTQLPTDKKIFYHSTDMFKQIANDSDSDFEATDVIYEHQQKKLNELYDISKNEMKFYCIWNEFIHNLKKNMKHGVFTKQVIIDHLSEFVCLKQLADLRVQLILHLNAMWCYGSITSNQVVYKLLDFDKAQQISVKSEQNK